MRCAQARQTIEDLIEFPGAEFTDGALKNHLDSCGRCRRFSDEMRRTWQALASYPAVESSAGFSQEFYRRLRAEKKGKRRATAWQTIVGWQWMAVAASICLFTMILAPQLPTPDRHPQGLELTRVDQWDDRFLLELEQSLDRTDADDLLSIYDSWPSGTPGADDADPTPGSAPKENGGPQREGA